MAVGAGCGCAGGAASGPASLEIRRAGCDDLLACYSPLEVDDDGRLVFAWDHRIRCLAPGLYTATVVSDCTPCGQVLLQFGADCVVSSAENIAYGPDCAGPEDTCAGSTSCAAPGGVCGCPATPVIYIPPYDVPRGC